MYDAASAALRVGREPLEVLPMLLGLRSAFCFVDDITAAKLWYTKVLGFAPYFDQPFYVGFNVGGFELGLSPDGPAPGKTPRAYGAYWGVKDIGSAHARLLELGAAPRTDIQDVGEGIRVADVLDPWGNVFGIIENPNFKLPS
jgi:catechol 2,3-dioxygenase-like lactoylglutathione lyase family enzyme